MAAVRRHRDLLSNAASLVATYGAASALGFVYWAVAARLLSQQTVGYGSAALSAMVLLGTIGMFGLGTVLIGELPRRSARAGLVSAALLASSAGSLVLGVAFAVVAPLVSHRFQQIISTPGQAALFAAGVAFTAMTLVFDQATIGLMRGGLQLLRNLIFSVTKLLVLPAAVIILHDDLGADITLSWVMSIAVSLVLIAVRLRSTGSQIMARPDWEVLKGLGRTTAAHNWLNLAIQVPWSLIPVIVAAIVSPSANAAFYAAWMLSTLLYMVPTQLSTVLFAVAAADPEALARKLRFTLRLSLLIGLPGVAALDLGAHLVLSMFGTGYARDATMPLWLLTMGYLPSIPRLHYIAVCRAAGKIQRAAGVLTAFAVVEVTAATIGCMSGGLVGVSAALLGVLLIEGLVLTPAVARAAIGYGRHRYANPAETASIAETGDPSGCHGRPPATDVTERSPRVTACSSSRDQQEAGIAALLALAVTAPMPAIPAGLPGRAQGIRRR